MRILYRHAILPDAAAQMRLHFEACVAAAYRAIIVAYRAPRCRRDKRASPAGLTLVARTRDDIKARC